jgi:hypothetical protein
MAYLRREYLGEQVLPNGFGQEFSACSAHNGHEPRQHQQCEPDQPWNRFKLQQPTAGTVNDAERQRGKTDDHEDHGAFQQHAGSKGGPEYRGTQPSLMRANLLGFPPEVSARHRPHGGNNGHEQHRIGFRHEPFDAQKHATCHHHGSEECSAS